MLFIRKGWRVNCPIYLRSPHHKTRSLNPTTNWTPVKQWSVYVSTYAVTASWIVYCPLLSETDEKSPFEPRVCAKSNWNASKIRANFQKQISTMSLWVAGCFGSVVYLNTTRLYLLTSTRKEMRTSSQSSFCQAKYQINIIMTAHSYFNSYFTRNHHDHINFVPNVLIIFISSVTTYRTPHISTEIPQVTIYHFYWIVLKLLPTLQSFFSDLVATLDIVIILCYLYYFSRLFYIF